MADPLRKLDLLPGTVDVLILRTLAWDAMHGYAIARFIRDQSDGAFAVEGAALYQALHRLERKGWVRSFWGVSDTNRKAKFYALTPPGRKQLRAQSDQMRLYIEKLAAMLAPR